MKISFAASAPTAPMRSPFRSGARTCSPTGSPASTRPARTLAARAAEAQRFEREAGAIAETFVDGGRAAPAGCC